MVVHAPTTVRAVDAHDRRCGQPWRFRGCVRPRRALWVTAGIDRIFQGGFRETILLPPWYTITGYLGLPDGQPTGSKPQTGVESSTLGRFFEAPARCVALPFAFIPPLSHRKGLRERREHGGGLANIDEYRAVIALQEDNGITAASCVGRPPDMPTPWCRHHDTAVGVAFPVAITTAPP